MLIWILPLGKGREKCLYDRFFATARSTLKVTLIIGGIQGATGGGSFLNHGHRGARWIWGLLMIIMAVVPVVGCSIIWVPAGIIMLLAGHIWEGRILATGVLVISTIDNLLRPVLIGKDVEMHPLMIFLSTLGGIVVFGFFGFVIGPIITSMLLAILEMYDEFFRKDPAAAE